MRVYPYTKFYQDKTRKVLCHVASNCGLMDWHIMVFGECDVMSSWAVHWGVRSGPGEVEKHFTAV